MQEISPLLGLGVVAFVSTNVDDLLVLVGFLADPKVKVGEVIAGQYLGIGALYLISLAGSLVSLVLAPQYVGFLGLAPVLIGAKKLYDLIRGHVGNGHKRDSLGSAARVSAVAIVTISNGGDNIGTYTPLFATHSMFEISIIGLVFILMTALWLLIAHWLVSHRRLGPPIRWYGYMLMPFVLIVLGITIMLKAGTLGLLTNG
jgi:cadmium resistance protein CadD (predicted permease)